MREVCEERDTLQGKVTLLTSNARRMDRDMKKLQADYDKLCNDKHQAGEQVRFTYVCLLQKQYFNFVAAQIYFPIVLYHWPVLLV